MSDKNSFEYFLMERNGLWSEHLQEVREKGFNDASPMARLIHSCEIGEIDQHASEDLKWISASLAALQASNAQKSLTIDALVTECDLMKQERDALREAAQLVLSRMPVQAEPDENGVKAISWLTASSPIWDAIDKLAAALKESK